MEPTHAVGPNGGWQAERALRRVPEACAGLREGFRPYLQAGTPRAARGGGHGELEHTKAAQQVGVQTAISTSSVRDVCKLLMQLLNANYF